MLGRVRALEATRRGRRSFGGNVLRENVMAGKKALQLETGAGLTHEGGNVEPGEVVGDPGLPLVGLFEHLSGRAEAPDDEAPEQGGGDCRRDDLREREREREREN